MTRYLIGVYWGPREESRESCAKRISKCLKALGEQEPAFSQWFKKVHSKKSALEALPIEVESLQTLLERSKYNAHRNLGFDFSAWTGRGSDMPASLNMPEYLNIRSSLSVSCGIYTTVVCNSAVLSFTPPEPPTAELLQGLLQATAAAFDPDDGVVLLENSLRAYPQLRVREIPALFRYKRGVGFTAGEVEYNPTAEQ
jgi:hypothetical protein